mmetsp:Transcript_6476/g.6697  ORF Transcript_6476/g.6697 Transcript_6476/m.6697 type:complete len:272 (+) Transcript_6476:38-853(+)
MEDEDELIPPPDHRGALDLTNRAWVNLDPVIWTMSKNIILLDVSYNHIFSFPPEIGSMTVLRELRASFNKLVTLPPEIGRLKRLKKMILNSNKMKTLPPELCRLEMLEELILSENVLEELPEHISGLFALRVLKLQNNRLKTLPFELADVVTLEDFDVSSNDHLSVVPKAWSGDTASLLFVLKVHRSYQLQLDDMRVTNTDMIRHAQYLEQEQSLMKERMGKMRDEVSRLRGAISTFRLMILDREAKIANTRAGDDEAEGTERVRSKCVIM